MSKRHSIICMVMLGVLAACTDGSTAPVSHVQSLTLQYPHDSLFFGRTMRIVANAVTDSTIGPNPRITWTSSDTTVAVVDSTGVVLGLNLGSARISAALAGRRDSMTVRVVLQRADNGVAFTEGSVNDGAFPRSCVATGGAVYCRTRPSAGDSVPRFVRQPGGAGLSLSSAHVSLHTVCALNADGRVFCWGTNAHYLFGGQGTFATDTGPIAVRTPVTFSSFVHAGHAQSCGINRVNDVVHCWGHNDAYQLARGSTSSQDSLAQPVSGDLRARRVYTTNFATCMLDLSDAAFCAGGLNSNRLYLGIDAATDAATTLLPVSGGIRFRSLALGDGFQCGIDGSDHAWCWGRNSAGQLGTGDSSATVTVGPKPVAGGLRFATISAIYNASACGITTTGALHCWGAFLPTSIATRIGARASRPYPLLPGLSFRSLIVSPGGMCATTTDGRTYCW
jgi:hypothetical protein